VPPGGLTVTLEYGRAGTLLARIRRAFAFVAIVWAVAATFVAFEIAALSATSVALAFPGLFGQLFLPEAITKSVTCVVSASERSGAQPEQAASEVLTRSWLLGVSVGRDAVARQWTSVNPQLLEASATGTRELASRLAAPAPALFVPRQLAMANSEFVLFVESDRTRTAHQLAVKYSSRACELYKFGAVWGYSTMVRPAMPGERAVFAAEIHYYARRLALPEPLWESMLERTPRDATTDQLITETTALTNGMTSYLMRER
jgi:hypothetical protein